MKRLMPAGLIDFLQTNPNVFRADLFAIQLPNGETINATDGQFDIHVPSGTGGWSGGTTTFFAAKYGRWSRGAITSEAGFGLNPNSMSLTCVPQQGTAFPIASGNPIGILNAAYQGLLDRAPVTVYTAYMTTWDDVSKGLETKWYGELEKISKINRVSVTWECEDPFFMLNEKLPRRLIQSSCPWNFCDSNCTLSAANYTVTFTAASGSTRSVLTPSSAFSQAAGYFSQGMVTCTSGANAGLSATVKTHDSSGNLELVLGFILPVQTGDGFSVIKGCDKTFSMCSGQVQANNTVVNNSVNYGGAPAVPAPSNAI